MWFIAGLTIFSTGLGLGYLLHDNSAAARNSASNTDRRSSTPRQVSSRSLPSVNNARQNQQTILQDTRQVTVSIHEERMLRDLETLSANELREMHNLLDKSKKFDISKTNAIYSIAAIRDMQEMNVNDKKKKIIKFIIVFQSVLQNNSTILDETETIESVIIHLKNLSEEWLVLFNSSMSNSYLDKLYGMKKIEHEAFLLTLSCVRSVTYKSLSQVCAIVEKACQDFTVKYKYIKCFYVIAKNLSDSDNSALLDLFKENMVCSKSYIWLKNLDLVLHNIENLYINDGYDEYVLNLKENHSLDLEFYRDLGKLSKSEGLNNINKLIDYANSKSIYNKVNRQMNR